MHKDKIFLWASLAIMGLLLSCGGRDKSEGLGLLLTRTSPLLEGQEKDTWDNLKLDPRYDCSKGGMRENARRLDDLSFSLNGGRNAEGRLSGSLEPGGNQGPISVGYVGYASNSLDLIYVQAIHSGQNVSYNVILSLCNYNISNTNNGGVERFISDNFGELRSFQIFNAEVANSGSLLGIVRNAHINFTSLGSALPKPQDRYFQGLSFQRF